MKAAKPAMLVILAVAIAGLAVHQSRVRQRRTALALAQEAARQKSARAAELERLAHQAPEPGPPANPVLSVEIQSGSATSAPAPANLSRPNPTKSATPPSAPAAGPEIQDPLARVALSLVGVDPAAEAYWVEAIFDPGLSDQEREDLMEDLNETGLSNPKRPAPEDFPLIANRIRIIEEVAPYADRFMLNHLGEAYNDLVVLYGRQ